MLDALLDHMPPPRGGENVNSPTYVRAALGPLKQLVRELDICAIFSMHPPKGKATSFRELVQASQAFSAIPRVGLCFAWHPDDDPDDPDWRRVVIRGKGNLGRNPGALEFRVTGRDYRHDDGILAEREVVDGVRLSGVTLADLLGSGQAFGREQPKWQRAQEIIRAELADGEWHEAHPIHQQPPRSILTIPMS
jgi:hypothetical protein